MTDSTALAAAREVLNIDDGYQPIEGGLLARNLAKVTETISKHYASRLEAAENVAKALDDVLGWAGKDKRRLTKRGWTLEKEIASTNKAHAALTAYSSAKEGK